jgi:multiple sugar transport system substrate-binding protein
MVLRLYRTGPAVLFGCAVLASLLSGCTRQSVTGDGGSTGVELMYWPSPNAQEVELADTMVMRWNRLHPGIHVRMQPIPVSQSSEEVLLAAIAGKTTPDICSNIWPGALRDYTDAGGLIALDGFADFDSALGSRMPRDLLEAFRSPDGHFYQLPWKTNPVMMYYNIDLFEKAGIDSPPRTYGEYLADARKIALESIRGGQNSVWMGERDIRPIWVQRLFDFYPFYIAASNGRTLFRDGKPDFDTTAAAAVFQFFQDCYRNRFFPRTFFQGGDPFFLGKKATHFAGPWNVAATAKFAPSMRYGVVPLPVPDGHQGPVYTSGDYKNISVFSNTRHPREAWEFAKFLITAEHDLLLLELADQIPVRGDLLKNPVFASYFRKKPVMVKFAEQAPYTRGMDPVPDLKEIFDGFAQVYERCAVFGEESAGQAVQDALRRTELIVEWNR